MNPVAVALSQGGASTKDLSAIAAGIMTEDYNSLLVAASAKRDAAFGSRHIAAKGGKNLIGPALYGIVGKQSASAPDYAYSSALQAYGKVWSFEELNAFLLKPQAYIKGTKMAYAGLRKDKDRASVILYLNSQSDSPLPKP